ncbi:tetratricopeptide repeat protein 21B-like [Zootermopsis nevadensis]|uniref:Tetratricopeptide repeat protein 21B n=1 Tax=Zootermopsis nevadensis TaxID=136037 RepID=A0A067QXT2_ZOONE|nr:tetratricopeptide repeat protein 21B-like [Zootermopsis nevadensis]XP_021937615.1 tetratricopeptide repeat protein 21B-like [Zootermopsis nevadensis]XP_021937616.1 tetratricopeptide repeat protein 21B-like [Zootermopsis nevadensis]XP_021937617.1 tetratricopeptide repeat protein 21B-like [Zootermopsis nevadensis]XP_021937618.1 tetratricopeptide repeat protein 21B-like [Zootermopsis nevadensis]XP_021937622.1 tetratricopeptide repeat protein 21B-like [Zootermopsis nevadensis]XP_021937623.1 te
MEDKDLKAKIHYYCREKLYHAMQSAALDGLRKFPGDVTFHLYNGLSLVLGHRIQEGIRELQPLQSDRDVMLGAILALMFAHRRCSVVDREALAQLDKRLKEERKHAGEMGLYHGAVVLFYTGKPEKARDYADRLLKSNSISPDGLVIKGWIEMYVGKEGIFKDIPHYFESALEHSPGKRNIDAVFGKAHFLELQNDYEGAIGLLNQLVVRFPTFTPPLVEKMKNQLALLDWDQATETANRILAADQHCLEAMKIKALVLICREGSHEEASLSLRYFYNEMEKSESKNAELFVENAQLFSRACGRNEVILAETYRFAERAAQLDPTSADFMTELGYQCLLQGKIREATRLYRSATKVDDSSVLALSGLTLCQLSESGANDQVRQQVEFLQEVEGSQPTPSLLLMSAKLVSGNAEKAVGFLNEAVEIHFRNLRTLPYGSKYLRSLDPDFLLQVVKEFLLYAPVSSSTAGIATGATPTLQQGLSSLPVPMKQSLTILEAVSKACPGLLEALYQFAYVQFISGDTKGASLTLQHILNDVDATCSDAHLLMAQILVQQGHYQRAAQSLEVGLSYNFKVREHPLYHLITALVQKQQGNIKECIETLQTAMTLTGLKAGSGGQVEATGGSPGLSLPDKASLYLELVEAHKSADQMHEAAKVMQDATDEFQGTTEEGRVTVANAILALHKGDIKLALEILQSIGPSHTYYQQACCKRAEIHLSHRKDRRAFAECFRELVENSPGPQSFVMLGDAYMSIQEPDRAIEAYEQALKRNPRDATLACKMGRALVKTHQYGKAINYYKEAVKGEDAGQLKLDMAELYMKLGQYDKAEKTLSQELEHKTDGSDMSSLEARTKLLLLLSKVREKAGNIQASLKTLRDARDNQSRVLKRMMVEQSGGGSEARQVAANICQQMAEYASMLRDHDAAIRFYKEALTYSPEDTKSLVDLARLYMQVNDLEQCQMSCMTLLKADADNEAATVMMADLAFRKVDFETAAFHFQQLLQRRPDYWTALARLVEVMRRTGNLEDVPFYLNKAEAACQRPSQEAGLAYCQGLYGWYSGNANSALRQFNRARLDPEWGQQAIYNMIEICLNPDDETLGTESAEGEDAEVRGSHEMALRMAERLLKELQPRPGGIGGDEVLNHRLLGNFLLLATRKKPNIEQALQDFASLATQDAYRDHVGTALGLATSYMLLKQIPRARNQLKRVAKNVWNFEDAEYLERCWLLLADIYIQNSKYDMASELLRRVLQHNKACTKAYEYAGYIAEKDQAYRDAANQYECAWKYGGQANPTIGYKLAFNYMKGKRYADAIDICQHVLRVQPDYPRIRKEILEKSRNNLRA